jgi:hypothetical protein
VRSVCAPTACAAAPAEVDACAAAPAEVDACAAAPAEVDAGAAAPAGGGRERHRQPFFTALAATRRPRARTHAS